MSPQALRYAVGACTRWASQQHSLVAAVVVAESNYDQRPADADQWNIAASEANSFGALFVAAVGNSAQAALVPPIATTNVVAVGAGARDGALCPFSPALTERVLLGPGCDPHTGWPAGSSAATASVGAFAAAIAARSPSLSALERRELIEASAVASASGNRRVDGSAVGMHMFGGLVAVPKGQDSPVLPAVFTEDAPAAAAKVVLWRPKVSARWRRGRLTVRRLTHRRTGVLVVEYSDRGIKRLATTRGTHLSVRTRRKPPRIRAWIDSRTPGSWRSLVRTAGVPR